MLFDHSLVNETLRIVPAHGWPIQCVMEGEAVGEFFGQGFQLGSHQNVVLGCSWGERELARYQEKRVKIECAYREKTWKLQAQRKLQMTAKAVGTVPHDTLTLVGIQQLHLNARVTRVFENEMENL